ncbi:Hypothetical predicted protein [Mytilus galloprovincialis]|nr:Hypothetical predicted protein [Mytilus galloprovincialis]
MAVLIAFCLSVAFLARTSSSLSCFDETCNPPMVCKVEFSHGYPLGGSCDQQHQHGHHPICGNSFPDHGHCHCDEQSCMSRVYTLTTPSLVPITTAVPTVPTVTTSTTQAPVVTSCVDNEDTTFNCKTYQDNYAMCQATTGTLKTIASNRCQKYCGLCGSNTAPPAPSTTASTAQTTCIDHEVKCSDQAYINIICSSSHQATKDYAIAICPKSCNLCTEHFASINPGFG